MKTKTSFLRSLVMIVASMIIHASLVAQQQADMSDAEVAAAAVAANQVDIGFGEVAKSKSKNADVLQFAETMIKDHQAVIQQAAALAKKLGVTPKENPLSRKLLSDAERTKKALRAKSGAAFNKAYIDNEVAYHKAVIAAVEGTLIPQTSNSELKQLLQNVVPALKAHLQHAEMIQKKFN